MAFHNALAEHKPQEIIAALEAGTLGDVHAVNKHGLTLLQIAAREGQLDVVLCLLNAHAEVDRAEHFEHRIPMVKTQALKTPLYFALERGHYIVAQVLLAAGASKADVRSVAELHQQTDISDKVDGLELDLSLLQATLSWGIVHCSEQYGVYFLKHILGKLSKGKTIDIDLDEKSNFDVHPGITMEMGGFIELAAQQNKIEAVKKLLTVGNVRRVKDIPTAGYWAAVHKNKEIADLVCTNEEDVLLTLKQLNNTNDLAFAWLFDLHPELQDKFYDQEDTVAPVEKLLTRKARIIYSAASHNDINLARHLKKSPLDQFGPMLLVALQQNNFVAIHHLFLQFTDEQLQELYYLVDKKVQITIYFMLLTRNAMVQMKFPHPYHSKDNSVYIVTQSLEFEGMFYQLISRNSQILQTQISEGDQEALTRFERYGMHSALKLNAMLRCLFDRQPFVDAEALLAVHDGPNINERCKRVDISPFTSDLLANHFKRFNIHVAFKQRIMSPAERCFPTFWQKVDNEFLNERDQQSLATVSRALRKAKQAPGMKKDLAELKKKLSLINRYLDAQMEDIDSRYCYQNRFFHWGRTDTSITLAALILLAGAGICAWFGSQFLTAEGNAHTILGNTYTNGTYLNGTYIPGTSCGDEYIRLCPSDLVPPACLDACLTYDRFLRWMQGLFVGTGFLGLAGIVGVITELFQSPRLMRGLERFDPYPIRDFSQATNDAASQMLADNQENFVGLSLASTCSELRERANQVKAGLESKIAILKGYLGIPDDENEEKVDVMGIIVESVPTSAKPKITSSSSSPAALFSATSRNVGYGTMNEVKTESKYDLETPLLRDTDLASDALAAIDLSNMNISHVINKTLRFRV